MIESTTRINNIAQRFEAGSQYPELFISNYNTYEEGLMSTRQLTLFEDQEETEKLLKERKIIWKETLN
jgi:DNA adenine methylase